MPYSAIGLVVPSQRFDANIDAYVTKLLEIRTSLTTASRRIPVRRILAGPSKSPVGAQAFLNTFAG